MPQTSQYGMSNPPYYSELLRGIATKANELGLYLVVSFFSEESYSRLYFQRMVGGLIVLANRMDDFRIVEAKKMQVPMVLIPGDPLQKDIPSVDGDSFSAVYQIIEHLSGLGHKRIGFLHGPKNSKYTLERLEAFRQALRRIHLPFDESILGELGDVVDKLKYYHLSDFVLKIRNLLKLVNNVPHFRSESHASNGNQLI